MRPELESLWTKYEKEGLHAVAEGFAALASPMTDEENGEWLRRMQSRCEEAEIANQEYEHATATDHMAKWVLAERAKGRPEHELTWGNCAVETGLETAEQQAEAIKP